MMDNELLHKYYAKARDSFKTKVNLFLFSIVIEKRDTFTIEDFVNFKISDEIVNLYSAEYWQLPRNSRINGLLIDDIYNKLKALRAENKERLKQLEDYYVKSFKNIFPEEEFELLLSAKRCHYCDISIEDLTKLSEKKRLYSKNERGWSLEIDRRNSNYEYTPDNCVMACYWCNNAKTDEFTEKEFKIVGETISDIWKSRLT